MNKKHLASWFVFLFVVFVALFSYPYLPAQMASHWGLVGEVNGYMSKTVSLIFLPALMLGILMLLLFLPKIDPLKNNIDKFRSYYDSFILIVESFLAYVFVLIIVWNLGFKFDLIRFLVPAMAILFYYLGIILPETRPNWIFGIRTPWTMMDGKVWYKTNLLAGRLFRLSGILTLGGFFFPHQAIYFIVIPVVAISIYLFFYSYLEFKKENT